MARHMHLSLSDEITVVSQYHAQQVVLTKQDESENPYCGDPTCWCHTDSDYHDVVIHPAITDEEIQTAYAFFEIG